MANSITISILGDERNLVGAVDRSEGKLGKLGRVAGGIGSVVAGGAAIAAGGILAIGVASVKSASDAQQSLGATETVFGKYADQVVKTSDKAATAYGLSANEYRNNANLIGSLFKNQGVATDQLATKSQNMIGVGADLAATFGGPTSEAVQALGSAFKGEFDPLERYGISIKQSAINAELAARGQDNLTGAALKAAQQQATTRLIMDQSKDSLGAFGRESGTLANQQQKLAANFENIKTKIGTALLPGLTAGAAFINEKFIPAFAEVAPKIGAFLAGIGSALGPFISLIIDTVGPVIGQLVSAFDGLGGSVSGGLLAPLSSLVPVVASLMFPFLALLPVLGSVASYLIATFGPALSALAGVIVTNVLPPLVRFGQFIISTVIPAVIKIAQEVGAKLRPILDQVAATIRDSVVPAIKQIAAKFEEWRPTIQRVISVVIVVVGAVLKLAAAILGKVLPPIIRFAGFLIRNVVPAVLGVIGVLVKIVGAVIKVGSIFVAGIGKIGQFVSGAKDKIGAFFTIVKAIPGKVLSTLGDLGSLLLKAGASIISGLIDGVKSKIGDLVGTLGSITDKIPDWKGPPKRDASLLFGAGQLIIGGLVNGFESRRRDVARSLGKFTDQVAAFDGGTTSGRRYIGAGGLPALRPINTHTKGKRSKLSSGDTAEAYSARTGNGGRGGGGTTVTIRVEVAPLSNPAEVGAAIQDALEAYYSAGGGSSR